MAKDKTAGHADVVSDRRGFLKLAGLGAVAGGATLATGKPVQAETVTSPTAAGYRETEHVKRAYATARF